jgi:hypothetical protein
MKNKIDKGNNSETDQMEPVYEAEIIDEDEEEKGGKMVPTDEHLPARTIAYKLGKAAGSIIAVLGVVNQLSHMFKPDRDVGRGPGKGRGRGRRRKRRRIR